MNICYLVNQYPKVSHTFIRREILSLEQLGATVTRVTARRTHEQLVDEVDLAENDITISLIDGNKQGLLRSAALTALKRPVNFIKALITTAKLAYASNKYVKNLAYLFEACELLRICEEKSIEHIHSHFGTNSTSVALLTRRLGGPTYSFTVHGPEEFDIPLQICLQEKIERAKFVVAITSFCRSQLFRWVSVEHWPKVVEVHCAVDSLMCDNPNQALPESTQLITIGRMCEQKGQMILFQALAELKKQGFTPRLSFVGDGELREELTQFAQQHGIIDQIDFLGWRSSKEIVDLLDASTALVLPSFAEGLPVVIMEAFARARPVITTKIAGIPELVDNQCGWLISAGHVDELVQAMREACESDTASLIQKGLEGNERIKARHNDLTEASRLLEAMKKSETEFTPLKR